MRRPVKGNGKHNPLFQLAKLSKLRARDDSPYSLSDPQHGVDGMLERLVLVKLARTGPTKGPFLEPFHHLRVVLGEIQGTTADGPVVFNVKEVADELATNRVREAGFKADSSLIYVIGEPGRRRNKDPLITGRTIHVDGGGSLMDTAFPPPIQGL